MQTPQRFRTVVRASRGAAAVLALALGGAALAMEIADAPLFSSSGSEVKPNVMLVFDDSASMTRDYLPDMQDPIDDTSYGYRSTQCNGMSYDPTTIYQVPVNADGTEKTAGNPSDYGIPEQFTNTRYPVDTLTSWPATNASFTIKVSSASSSTFAVGNRVTVYANDTGKSERFLVGTVESWNSSTRNLQIKVLFVTGSVTSASNMTNGRVNIGWPGKSIYYTYSGSRPKLSFAYNTSTGDVIKDNYYNECNVAATTASTIFTPAFPAATQTTSKTGLSQVQNYANWKAHYGTRMAAMKSGVSLAFNQLDVANPKYRVGYTTLSSTNVASGTNFLDVKLFDQAQKNTFYSNFNAATPPSSTFSTPLRGALSKVGRYFAKKMPSQSYDPIEYSCQRNYTIIATDGYWNTNNENSSYGPVMLDGSTKVGQQDGGATPRPMFDGGKVTQDVVETWTRTQVITTRQDTPRTTISTSTAISTTRVTTNWREDTNVVVKNFNTTSVTRSGNTVTVNMSGAHNLQNGDVVNMSGGGTSSNQNIFRGDKTITVVDADTFTYTVGNTNQNPGNTAYTVDPVGALACPTGQGVVRTTRRTQDRIATTETRTTTTTTTPSVSTVYGTITYAYPITRTITYVDGKQTNDTGPVEGARTTLSNVTSPATVVNGTPQVSVGSPQVTGPTNSTTAWTTTILTSGPCVSTAPANTSAAVGTSTSTTPSSSSTGPNTTNDSNPAPVETSNTSTYGPKTTTNKTPILAGGVSNSLADVAMYYYQTDLRTETLNNCIGSRGVDVCQNNVPGSKNTDAVYSGGDVAAHQHLTTFTIGLGVVGERKYTDDYFTNPAADFLKILKGDLNWPIPKEVQYFPPPANIDDLWHAAVNGRGQYFSADSPDTLVKSLNNALNGLGGKTGAAAAASTSSLQPVQGDNDIYVAQFRSQEWWGDVLSYEIDPKTGQVSTDVKWSAKKVMSGINPASRTILFPDKDPTKKTLVPFEFDKLQEHGHESKFINFCDKVGAGGGKPTQCADLADKTEANKGANLVAYLRGNQSFAFYRQRMDLIAKIPTVLGDVINASPLFVGKPNFKYNATSYQEFAETNKNRPALVLVASNDGMLHALSRDKGEEQWAFIPSFVLPNLYKLADEGFANNHSYFVDGSPQIGDIQLADGTWKTIVVGGLNKGGRGYYALDVTDTTKPPVLMWEFSHADLGLTYGNPIITKRANGKWAVVFGSGLNNGTQDDGSPNGDGNGHLFVLDAEKGTLVAKVSTMAKSDGKAVGTPGNPSGLAKINNWVDSDLDNTSVRYYGGDTLGNLWRFQLDESTSPPTGTALQLAQLTTPPDPSLPSVPQPITTRPVLAEVDYNGSKFPVVYVTTGQYLNTADLSDKHRQSIYAIKDPLTTDSLGVIRSRTDFVVQTITAKGDENRDRSSSNEKVDWITKGGWRADFPLAGERVSVNPQIALGTIFVGTNVPNDDACSAGGRSFLYEFDYATGVSTATFIGDVLVQGLTLVQLTEAGGAADSLVTIITLSDGTVDEKITDPGSAGGTLRRSSWREIVE